MNENEYHGPFWAFVTDCLGMPISIERRMFAPTIHPYPKGHWIELWRAGHSPDFIRGLEEAAKICDRNAEMASDLTNHYASRCAEEIRALKVDSRSRHGGDL